MMSTKITEDVDEVFWDEVAILNLQLSALRNTIADGDDSPPRLVELTRDIMMGDSKNEWVLHRQSLRDQIQRVRELAFCSDLESKALFDLEKRILSCSEIVDYIDAAIEELKTIEYEIEKRDARISIGHRTGRFVHFSAAPDLLIADSKGLNSESLSSKLSFPPADEAIGDDKVTQNRKRWHDRLSVDIGESTVVLDGKTYQVSDDAARLFWELRENYPKNVIASELNIRFSRLRNHLGKPLAAIVESSTTGVFLVDN